MAHPIHISAYKRFLKKLVQARKDSGLSQMQVAKRLKTRQTWVSKSELGERRVDVVELSQFARIYKKSLDYFLK